MPRRGMQSKKKAPSKSGATAGQLVVNRNSG
jgi:hypothetical protein